MRKFIDIISETRAYDEMPTGLVNNFAKGKVKINDSWIDENYRKELKWARKYLKREDRIVWYLRIAKMELIFSVRMQVNMDGITLGGAPREKTPLQIAVDGIWKKALADWEAKMGYPFPIKKRYDGSTVLDTQPRAVYSHFASMAEQVPGIRAYRWDRQSPNALLADLKVIEDEWRAENARRKRYVKNGADKAVMTFPDGMFWAHLDRTSCKIEGEAMGHCGNSAAEKPGDTILSLRAPSDRAGYSHPALTFILHRNGTLGEMKGRFNEKPEARYHPHIVALLKMPLIKGITGGGYDAARNFSLNDLSTTDREALVREKPELGRRDS